MFFPRLGTQQAAQPFPTRLEERVQARPELNPQLSREQIVRTTVQAIQEHDDRPLKERLSSEEYRSNPFNMATKSVFLPYSFEEGLRFMQDLAADPLVPLEGHYFFGGRAWYNITHHDQLRFHPTGELDPLFIFVTSTLTTPEEVSRISREFAGGTFAHYHPIPALMNMGNDIKRRAYEILRLPPPRTYEKNTSVLSLPSVQDLILYATFQVSNPAEKQFHFCVCNERATVFFGLDETYAACLREMRLPESRERLRAHAEEYQAVCAALAQDPEKTLDECVAVVSAAMNKDDVRFVFRAEERKREERSQE